MQELLLAISSIAEDVFVFQQANPASHHADDETVELLHCETLSLSVLGSQQS